MEMGLLSVCGIVLWDSVLRILLFALSPVDLCGLKVYLCLLGLKKETRATVWSEPTQDLGWLGLF